MPVFLFSTILVLTFLCREIRVGVTADIDLLKSWASIKACVFGITVYRAKVTFDPTNKTVVSKPKKPGKKAARSPKKRFPLDSILTILTNLRIQYIETEVHAGFAHDPFLTTLAFGSIRVLLYGILGFIKTRFHVKKTCEKLVPEYQSDRHDALIAAEVYISPADIIYGLILLAVKKLRHKARQKRKNKQEVYL